MLPINILELPSRLVVPSHSSVLLVRPAQIIVSALELLSRYPKLLDPRLLQIGKVFACEHNLDVLHQVSLPRRERHDAATSIGLWERDNIAHEALDALILRHPPTRICLAVEAPDDTARKREQELRAEREVAQLRRQPSDPQVVRQSVLRHGRHLSAQRRIATDADRNFLVRISHELSA